MATKPKIPLTRVEYATYEGKYCPVCGGQHISYVALSSEYKTTELVMRHVWCPDCTSQWWEVWDKDSKILAYCDLT